MKVTFAVSQKLQLKVVKSEPEYVSGQLQLASPESEFGPNGLPIATFYFLTGSDEDTIAYVMRVSFEKDGFVKVRYLDSVSTFNDGPNDSSHVTAAKAKLYKQSAKTGKFFPIK